MKINLLTLEGFGPFHTRQEIDFSHFRGELFLISGRTGHGKSSILDGIAYGLYGKVPRFGPEATPAIRSTFSQAGEKTEVVLEFSLSDQSYRITRSPSYPRPKARGEGETDTKEEALLERLLPSGWEVIAQGKQSVGSEVNSLIRLNNEQFLQVIMLAQNRFREFLHAPSENRREILRAIFSTKSYSDFVDIIGEREREEREKSEAIRNTIERILEEASRLDDTLEDAPDVDDWWAWASSVLEAKDKTLEQESLATKAERAKAAKKLSEAEETAEAQDQRAKFQLKHDALIEDKDTIEELKAAIGAAHRAEGFRPFLDNRNEAQTAQIEARNFLQKVATDLGRDVATDTKQDVTQHVSEVSQLVVRLEPLIATEKDLPTRTREAERLRTELGTLVEKLTGNTNTRGEKKKESEEAALEVRKLRKTLESHTSTPQSLDKVNKALEAARQLDDVEKKHTALKKKLEEEETVLAQITKDLKELRKKRIDGIASELASNLVTGEPCTVCGSKEHPELARPTKNSVTEEQVSTAQVAQEAKETVVKVLKDGLSQLVAESAGHRAITEGKTIAELEQVVAETSHELASREKVAEAIHQLEALLALNESTKEDLEKQGNDLSVEKATVETNLASLEKELEKDEQALSAHREEFGTVSERHGHLNHTLDKLKDYEQAFTGEDAAEKRLEKESEKLETKISGSVFGSEEDLVSALKDEDWRADNQKRVSEHEDQLKEVLTLLERLKKVPAEAIDVETIRRESAKKDSADDEVTSRLTLIRDRMSSLRNLRDKHDSAVREGAERAARYDNLRSFSETLKGKTPNEKRMNLETFVLASQLEDIVEAANRRFATMSDSRYLLEHDDERGKGQGQFGLGIKVFDNFTGVSRMPTSLSGGETFLASLALALGLADVVTETNGAIELDTLFIDEGFGSLDQETLETTMDTLDSLRAGGRTVGVISHVDSMKEQIPLQIRVAQGADHASTIRLVG